MSTDAGTPFHAHGRNVAEITAMVGQGLEPAAAIEAATTTGAEALGLGARSAASRRASAPTC